MKEREFINPFTDFGFKRIFGQEINKELTIDFLNLLLDGERHIADLTIHNPEIKVSFYRGVCITRAGLL